MIALADGVIVKTYKAPSGQTAGWQVTLRGASNAWFYGHLATVSVRAGDRVRKGQTIGTSGPPTACPISISANSPARRTSTRRNAT